MRILLTILLLMFLSGPVCAEIKDCVLIDIGHTEERPGTISPFGKTEISYNREIAYGLKGSLEAKGFTVKHIENVPLSERPEIINNSACSLFISIHHDSVQPFLDPDLYSGFSIFTQNNFPEGNYSFWIAFYTGDEMLKRGFRPSLHHAADIDGERKHLLDAKRGIYAANFYILRKTRVPGILLECGVITNRGEALKMDKKETKDQIISAISSAIELYYSSIHKNSEKSQKF